MRLTLPMTLISSILLSLTLTLAQAQTIPVQMASLQRADLAKIVAKHAVSNGIPAALVEAIITVESSWQLGARNGSSVGLMQIEPRTARSLGYKGEPSQLYDPETNIQFGTRYLAEAYRLSSGDLCTTVARYQSGHNMVKPNAANRAYCKKMQALLTP